MKTFLKAGPCKRGWGDLVCLSDALLRGVLHTRRTGGGRGFECFYSEHRAGDRGRGRHFFELLLVEPSLDVGLLVGASVLEHHGLAHELEAEGAAEVRDRALNKL